MWTFPGYEIREIVCDSPRIVTYRGIRLQDKQKILFKVCKAEHPSVRDIASLREEYEIGRVLDVDGVVKSYALEAWNHGIVLIQEDFGGVTLAQAFRGVALEVNRVLSIAVQLAAILEEVHRNNIVHHSINPGNILVNVSTGRVKVTGFGATWRNAVEESTFQEPGILENILPYISPEQTGRIERTVDYRTDFYSLGVTLYELLTGKLPFPATDALELIHAHIAKNPDAPQSLNKSVPQAISDIVLKLLSKNAEARYFSAYGLKTDLTECLTQWRACCEIVGFLPGRYDVSDKWQVPRQIYGRERETNALLEAFARVKDGAKVVMLAVGPSGVGKSTLMSGARSAIVAQGGNFVSGKFDQLQQDRPYSAIIQAFRELIRQFLAEGEDRIAVGKSTLLNALGVNGKVILDVIPEVRLLIGEQPNVPELTPTEAQNRFTMVLRNFVKALSTPERPLVIFLDDLQWADSASLRLLLLLMAEPESQHLLVLGSYRDNEVSAEHPLPKALEELRNSGCQVEQLDIVPLELPQVNQLLTDLLHCTLPDALPLVELVLTKTHGNPFFVLEFVKALRSDGLLTFDFQRGGWQWDIAAIRVRDVADNVAELVAKKVQKQKPEIQHMLRWAACIGNRFTLEMLANVCERSLSEMNVALLAAIKEELILPTNEEAQQIDSHPQEAGSPIVNEYKFIHDQVRQACYALLSSAEQEAMHLHVGRVLLCTASVAERDQQVFDIVNHMNLGRAYVSQQAERKALAALNLEAGGRAKSLTAYHAALRYLQIGLELLGEESWETDYKLSLDISVAVVEAAYLNHDFPYMEDLITTALGKINNLLDKAKIYEVKLQALISEGRRLEAVQLGLFVLGLLGVKFLAKPSKVQASRSLTKVRRLLAEKCIEELYHLPEMTDPTALVTSRVLRIILNPVFLAAPELLPLVISQQIQVSVTYGNTADSAYFYAQYGLLLCGAKGDIEGGLQFAQLALQLLERFDAKTLKAKVYMTTHSFVLPWTRHLRKSIEPLREGYLAALETGDFVYAAYLGPMQPVFAYFCGVELGKVVQELGPHIEGVRRLKQERTQYGPLVYQQAAVNLLECQPQPSRLAGKWYDERRMLPLHAMYAETTAHYYLSKLMLCYLFHEYREALEHAVNLEKLLFVFRGHMWGAMFYFYQSLALLAVCPERVGGERKRVLAQVGGNQKKVKKWIRHAPMNYLHKLYLVEAEYARVLGKDREASECYEKAISLAQQHEYLNEEALAYELAGKFYLTKGQVHPARYYLRDAYYAYQRWGANAKVRDLEVCYPQFFLTQVAPTHNPIATTPDTEQHLPTALDVQSVLKASQALASEIVLDKLLARLMRIVMENAGAQRGVLLFVRNGQLIIEAEGRSEQEDVPVLHSVPVETRDDLPISLLRYVGRTKEQIVLNNAAESPTFAADPYLVNNRPKSILCTPLIKQDQLTGILYLENNLTIGVFTPDKLEVVNVLATEAAISIENARLYRSLEEANEQLADYSKTLEVKVEERTQDLQQKNQELEEASQQVNEANRRKSRFLAGMSHQLRTPMNAILGFTRLVLRRAGDILPERQRDNLVKVRESAENLLSLINQLLDLSKIEAGRMEIHPSLFDVKKFVVGCVDTVAPLVKPGVLLRSEAIDGIDNANTDEDGLRQIMLNLLSNAVKFTEVGEVVVRVSREERENSETWLVISVLDTGPGIAADALERIFDEFEQLGQSNLHGEKRGSWLATGARRLTDLQEGTGLGLPIAQRWAELLGGSISVQSELGKGSTFTVSIPMIYRTSQGALVENRVL